MVIQGTKFSQNWARHSRGDDENLYSNLFVPLVVPNTPPPFCTTINLLVIRVVHNKFDQNWAITFRVDVENINFPNITLCMTMWTLTPIRVTCFSVCAIYNNSYGIIQLNIIMLYYVEDTFFSILGLYRAMTSWFIGGHCRLNVLQCDRTHKRQQPSDVIEPLI